MVESTDPLKPYNIPGSECLEEWIIENFEASSPEVLQAAKDCFRINIFGRFREPMDHLQHPWPTPGEYYVGQWLWDTMFIIDLLAMHPTGSELIAGIFQNYWNTVDIWNAENPSYAHDMVSCVSRPPFFRDTMRPRRISEYSQIPILAWGLERVFLKTDDLSLIKSAIPRVEKFHQWYWRERDTTDIGLCSVGSYNGDAKFARYESFDQECCLDDLQLSSHPLDSGRKGNYYGNILLPGITSYLICSERSLARLAKRVGDSATEKRCLARVDKAVQAMQEYMWNESEGTYLAVWRDKPNQQINVPTIGSWIPLMAEVPTNEQAARMAEVFATPDWLTKCAVPTVARSSKHFNADTHMPHGLLFWRGDCWPPTNFQVASGFACYGYAEIAGQVCDSMFESVLAHGFYERYHPDTGKPLGVKNIGFSCAALMMLLDGFSLKHYLRWKS